MTPEEIGRNPKPRRRIVLTATIEADSWEALYNHLCNLTTQMAMDPEYRLSKSSVSGGYDSGHVITTNEDETITHDSWAADLDAYLEGLRVRRALEGGE